MSNHLLLVIFLFLSFFANSQNEKFRILPEAGISNPSGDLKANNAFAKRGHQVGLNLDLLFGKIGLGLYGGLDKNNINFTDNLPTNISTLSRSSDIKKYDWKQLMAGLGPVIQFDFTKKFNIELAPKIGFAKFIYPDYRQYAEMGSPINKGYILYQTRNEDIEKKYNLALLAALRLNFKISKSLDFSVSGNYKNVGKVLHSYTYLLGDFNPNMTQGQLIEVLRKAKTVTEIRECNFNTFGLVAGLSFKFGGGKKKPKEENHEKEIMDPPMLEFPEDSASISFVQADSLVLKWIKENPNVENANYNLWLYKVADSAIRKNDTLLLQTKVIKELQFQLAKRIKFEEGQTYRWLVQATDDNKLRPCPDGCFSQQAIFLIVRNSTTYAVLKKKLDAGYYSLSAGYLKFKFEEEYVNSNNSLVFSIYDPNRQVVVSNTSPGMTLSTAYKDNRFVLDINAINPPLQIGFYILEVKDKKGEISMLRFKL